jgi:hypothetical protein|tara:strand:- start:1228 stop:2205 length:978 start_codon:yes stop_codon:yes gene_type:complete
MTWSDLIDRVLVGFPFQDTGEFNRTRTLKYLEEGQEDFSFYTQCFEKNFSFYLDDGDEELDLPIDFNSLVSTVEFKGKNVAPFQRSETITRRKTDNTFRTGFPEYFEIQGNKMSFVPAPSTGGLLTFRYSAKPTNLTDSATQYTKVRYDTLTSSAPYIGDTLNAKALSGGVYDQSVDWSATVADVDINNLEGIITLTGEDNGSNLNNNHQLVSVDDETTMWLGIYSDSWSTLLTNWNDLGLGFKSLANGNSFAFATAGDTPQIDAIYHPMLVDYAKAAYLWETGSPMAGTYQQKYESNRESARKQFAHKGYHGPRSVIDAVSAWQ